MGEPVTGFALQGQAQPFPRLVPPPQPLGQAGSLVQLVPGDRTPILDHEAAVTLLVPEDFFLATAERGGAIGLAVLDRQRRQAIERLGIAGLDRDELFQGGTFGLRVVPLRGEPGAEGPLLRHREAIGWDFGQRARASEALRRPRPIARPCQTTGSSGR